ncbi:WD40/YVTN/BNR-like repeat-containing protein [Actinopolymorpha alba]|uniref:WD40/YVTN/BNR-like repeat-containing protein n=1 Tax=Actinopolymorpha alba TaxID=533267 RepID=UPI00039FD770|nr:hypothetical protein [Actinopolymorpha alba]
MAKVRRAGVAALAAFVVVDVVLVGLALRHVRGDSAALREAGSTPFPSATAQPSGTPTAEPKPTASSGNRPPVPAPDAAASRTMVDIGRGRAVARAVSGICGKGGGNVELSLDGGQTFVKSDVPSAAVIIRVASVDADTASIVATGTDCRSVTTFTTTNGGGTWEQADGSDGSWHRLPRAAARLHAPTGNADVPCADGQVVTAFSTLSGDQAYALCGDGAVQRTLDGGQSWKERGEVPGAADLDFVDRSTGLAVVTGDPSCAGIAVMKTSDGGTSWKSQTCVETDASELPDVSADSERAYIGAGEALWYTEDGGASWEPRSP